MFVCAFILQTVIFIKSGKKSKGREGIFFMVGGGAGRKKGEREDWLGPKGGSSK